ncbi:tyrosine-type recombinase/integrase [Deinococcus apachensis]|uniref:tyrosine-type recombinase/integrase n=1 Tax=Deinococcus apachensis TaxID=309886 RepID=UPI000A01A9DB
MRFHDLRHTYASLMLSKGVPMEVVSEKLGHSRPSTTADIYRHIFAEEHEQQPSPLQTCSRPSPSSSGAQPSKWKRTPTRNLRLKDHRNALLPPVQEDQSWVLVDDGCSRKHGAS